MKINILLVTAIIIVIFIDWLSIRNISYSLEPPLPVLPAQHIPPPAGGYSAFTFPTTTPKTAVVPAMIYPSSTIKTTQPIEPTQVCYNLMDGQHCENK